MLLLMLMDWQERFPRVVFLTGSCRIGAPASYRHKVADFGTFFMVEDF
jgi:hypothetical protein